MAFAMGISVEEFKHMTPYKLECCLKGHRMNRQMRDEEQYLWWGKYGVSAVYTAVEHCLAKKPKSKFAEKPIFSHLSENAELTEEQRYEKEVKKVLLAEEQWIMAGKRKGLPETII